MEDELWVLLKYISLVLVISMLPILTNLVYMLAIKSVDIFSFFDKKNVPKPNSEFVFQSMLRQSLIFCCIHSESMNLERIEILEKRLQRIGIGDNLIRYEANTLLALRSEDFFDIMRVRANYLDEGQLLYIGKELCLLCGLLKDEESIKFAKKYVEECLWIEFEELECFSYQC